MPSGGRFDRAVALIDAANAEDPRQESVDGVDQPKELVYAGRMSERLARFRPDASEPLRLAVRGQHVRRWTSPRTDYPEGRAGYRRWRSDLYDFHARTVGDLLTDAGYDADTIARVQSLVRKERLKVDPEAQALEDVACLVFLEHYAPAFAGQHEESKIVDVLRKTWRKMSDSGREAALELSLEPSVRELVQTALAGSGHAKG